LPVIERSLVNFVGAFQLVRNGDSNGASLAGLGAKFFFFVKEIILALVLP
jgi:hypothetical protein